MNKTITKRSHFLAVLLTFMFGPVFAQTITIGAVDPGPYGAGSTIEVPIAVNSSSGCIEKTNTFNLYLSDASGNFAAKKLIGSLNYFYATYVNGLIPAGTPAGSGYKVMVVSTVPAVTSSTSAAFTINAVAGVVAGLNSTVINPSYPEVFGNCGGKTGTSFAFIDQSTTGSTVTANFYNETTSAAEGSINPVPSANFVAKNSTYTISEKSVNGGIVGTKGYTLINNSVNNSFGATGSTSTCLGTGTGLSYNVDITSSTGIQTNYPGLLYTIAWGDAAIDTLSLCEIVSAGGVISHVYKKTSCGNSANGQPNSFEVDLQPISKYCGNVGTRVTSYAKVASSPVNSFNLPASSACVNTLLSFFNTSFPGDDPNNSSSTCVNAKATYSWLIDGATVSVNDTLKQPFSYTFKTTGIHTVTLHFEGNGTLCSDTDVTHKICIQNPPQLAFTLPGAKFCAPAKVTPTNLSILDTNCDNTYQYTWVINGPKGGTTFANGTNGNSAVPQFVFSQAGTYSISLTVYTASCGYSGTPIQTLTVDSIAVAKLSKDTILCGGNQVLSFNPTAGATKTILTGTAQSSASPFVWSVTGGNFKYVNGTSDTSQYPQINFADLAKYTISVSNTNSCGNPSVAVQHITFQQAPIVSAGADMTICPNGAATLNGSITGGAYNSLQWIGGTGTFLPDRNTLNATYTPSAAEITTGSLSLTLQVNTTLVPPCNTILSSVNIKISPKDSLSSTSSAAICSGVALNYQLAASLPNSTFTWAVDPNNTTASASGYKSGSGTAITDVLSNSDPVNSATVTYNVNVISPGNCSFIFPFVVTVAPKQAVAKFTQNVTSGCDSLNVQFTNQSLPANSTYVWNFGDGSQPSTISNPSHTFAPRTDGKDTVYTVTLNSSSTCGVSTPYTTKITVSPKVPISYITPQQILGCSPFTLTVDNYSPGTNKSYTYYLFQDSTLVQQITTTDKSEVHFNPIATLSTKQYSLYMNATNSCGTVGQSNVIPITVSATTIIAQMFIENGQSKGCAPFTVNLINNSFGADSYYYTVYDANNVVIDRKLAGNTPMPYIFKAAGTYYVTVSASNSCSTVESSPPVRIDVYAVPLPDFTADVTTACKSVTVNFTNQTPDDVNTQAVSLLYDWDYGDGSAHSFTYTPAPHTYGYTNSPYSVTLTATNLVTNCVNTITKTNYITVTAPPVTAFTIKPDSVTTIPNYRFSFFDATPGAPISWYWTFGDGSTAVTQNPGHTYADTGIYKVTLTAASKVGCDSTIFHYVRITGVPGQLFLPNAFEPSSGTIELQTFKAKGSGIKAWHMQIFNNFSQLVWETTRLDAKGAPVDGWDGTFNGKPAPQGVYIWQVSASFLNGSEWKGNVINNSLPKRTGTLNLIR